MSITFWVHDPAYVPPAAGLSDEELFDTPSLPEVSLSNANARAMLELMGLCPSQDAGELAGDALAAPIALLTRAVNLASERESTCQAPRVDAGRMRLEHLPSGGVRLVRGPELYESGRSDAYVERTARRLLGVLTAARSRQLVVYWG